MTSTQLIPINRKLLPKSRPMIKAAKERKEVWVVIKGHVYK
jgi:hypothetical protein